MQIGTAGHIFTDSHSLKNETENVNKLSQKEVDEFQAQIDSYKEQIAINTLENFKEQFIQNPVDESIDIENFTIEDIEQLTFDESGSFDENGYFGIDQTSTRISDFVINGAENSIDLLRAGKEGVTKGYEEAKEIMGEELPQIAEDTFIKAIENINEHIAKLGFNILDIRA